MSSTKMEADSAQDTDQTTVDVKNDIETGSMPVDSQAVQSTDPNIVDWDGPDDPENPMNWPSSKKTSAVIIIATITFVTPVASSIFAPAIEEVMKDFKSTNEELSSFIVSVYLIGFCFGPLILAPLSEMYGRLYVYQVCNVGFIIFTIACAVAPTLPALIIFRLLAGLFGSCPVTLGASSLADMFPPERRGAVMSSWVMGPIIGPVVGPIAGGYLTQAKSWRWTFWVVAMLSGVITIGSFIFMRETYAYTILQQKTNRLRKETGNDKLRSVRDDGRSPKELFQTAIVRPTKMLFSLPIVFLLSLYMGIIFGYLYLIFTAIPKLYGVEYGFSTGSVGLTYIGSGCGSFCGVIVAGLTSDRCRAYFTKKYGGEPKPEYRLPPLLVACFFVPLGLFLFGWSAEKHYHWIVPIISLSFLGFGMILSFMSISVYMVDAYTRYSASAMSANTVFRSLLGALLPLAGQRMYDALGYGWGSSLLAFIAVAMIPFPIIFWIYGERIRNKTLFGVKIE